MGSFSACGNLRSYPQVHVSQLLAPTEEQAMIIRIVLLNRRRLKYRGCNTVL